MRLHFRQGTTQGNFQCVCYHWLINPYLSCYLATRLILLRRNNHIGAQPQQLRFRWWASKLANLPPTATTPIPLHPRFRIPRQAGIMRPRISVLSLSRVARAWAMHRTMAICNKSEPTKPGSITAMLPWLYLLLPSGHPPPGVASPSPQSTQGGLATWTHTPRERNQVAYSSPNSTENEQLCVQSL